MQVVVVVLFCFFLFTFRQVNSKTSFIRVKLRTLHSLCERSGRDVKNRSLIKQHGIDLILATISVTARVLTEHRRQNYRQDGNTTRTRSAYVGVCTPVRQKLRRVFKVKCVFAVPPHMACTFEYFYGEGMQIRTSAQHR